MPSHTALITALILERPLCMECLKAKANLSEMDIGVALATMQAVLSIHMEQGRCRACGTDGVVIHSEWPADRPVAVMLSNRRRARTPWGMADRA